MENKQETWDQIKLFYKEKFNLEPELIDIMADYDIIKLCASGSSNESIAKFLNLETYTIEYVVDSRFGFIGWVSDLPFSPLALYKELDRPDEAKFVDEVVIRHGHLLNIDIHRMYQAAYLVEKLERILDESWI